MTFKTQEELMQALIDGKKLHYKNGVDNYLHLVNGTLASKNLDQDINFFIMHPDSWELYKETQHSNDDHERF